MIAKSAVMTKERLRQLLEEGSESEDLDYKETLDPNDKGALMELAKDLGAMQTSGGGYIVVGADSQGRPSELFTRAHERLFDEATLRKKLRRWIPEPFTLRSAMYELDQRPYVLIYTSRQDGPCIFDETARYSKPNGKEKLVFQKSDIFIRHGSSSEKVEQHDVSRIFKRQSPVLEDTERPAEEAAGGELYAQSHAIEAIQEVLAAEYDIDPGRVTADASLSEDLSLDQSAVLELIIAVEEILGLDLRDEEFLTKRFVTVGDLTGLFG